MIRGVADLRCCAVYCAGSLALWCAAALDCGIVYCAVLIRGVADLSAA